MAIISKELFGAMSSFMITWNPQEYPYTETYWECENIAYVEQYGGTLPSLDYAPPGADHGVSVVSVGHADYTFTTDVDELIKIGHINDQIKNDGTEYTPEDLIEDIATIHKQKGRVKLSFGGKGFPMGLNICSHADIDEFVANVTGVIAQDRFDGIDFDLEDGGCPADLQIALFKQLHKALKGKTLMSLSLPPLALYLEPYGTVVKETASLFDHITIKTFNAYWPGYDFFQDIQRLEDFGVKRRNIILAVMPGVNDDGVETTVETCQNLAEFVRRHDLRGISIWPCYLDDNGQFADTISKVFEDTR